MSTKIYLTVTDTAALLDVCNQTIYRMIREDAIACRQIGKKSYRIVVADLLKAYPELAGHPLLMLEDA